MIFDFDGVVVDSEPIHLEAFQRVLGKSRVELTREGYYTKYLGFDDQGCFEAVMRDRGRRVSQSQIDRMIAEKTILVQELMRESIKPLDGAEPLIRSVHEAGVPLAVCSGALLAEIELASIAVGVRDFFRIIVGAEDVDRGKPDPEGYNLALTRLRQVTGCELDAGRCLVLEDSPAGIDAAREAGMKVLAVTSSYPAEALSRADRIVGTLSQVTIHELTELFVNRSH